MRTGMLLFVLILFTVPTSVTAQCMPEGADNVGIYTEPDQSGIPYAEIPVGTMQTVYLCITNCSHTQLRGWELLLRLETPPEAPIIIGSVSLRSEGGALDLDETMLGFIVGIEFPMAPDEHGMIVLADIDIVSIGEGYLYAGPQAASSLDGQMYYIDHTDLYEYIPLYPSSGSFNQPVFAVNAPYIDPCGVVPAEQSTWGAIKSIYR